MKNNIHYKLGEMARMLHIHEKTLQSYDYKLDGFQAKRTETGRRYYTIEDYNFLLPVVINNKKKGHIVTNHQGYR